MTTLKTYGKGDRPIAPVLRTRDHMPPLEPGTFVEVPGLKSGGGFGMVVAVVGDEVAVLWSKEPPPPVDFWDPNNPLAADEDFYIETSAPDEEDQLLAPIKPDPENDAWVAEQWKRIAGAKR